VCVCVYIYTHTHIYIYIYTHTHTHTHTQQLVRVVLFSWLYQLFYIYSIPPDDGL